MRIAVCPGSFDPVTKGHLDIVTRASKLFDRVIVLVVINAAKTPSFSPEERVQMIREVIGGSLPNVEVDTFSAFWPIMSGTWARWPLSRACGQCRILNMNFRWRWPIKN